MNNINKAGVPDSSNLKKNRLTIVALFALFVVPVVIAYSAYFAGWFSGATKNNGELLAEALVLDIEDFRFVRNNGDTITGKEFETFYWWLIPLEQSKCDENCIDRHLYIVNQTYVGLGKERKRISPLLVLPHGTSVKNQEFPIAHSEFIEGGVKPLPKTQSGKDQSLPANFIYLVDPLGNIFMRYPLVKDEASGPELSKKLRDDIRRLFKLSRLG